VITVEREIQGERKLVTIEGTEQASGAAGPEN
jgi:hypothetical protein